MLEVDIAEGSGIRGRTVHGGGRFHGRFGVQSGTVHAGGRYRGRFGVQRANHPRSGHKSRMVQVSGVEPSTLEVDIMEGSGSKAEPSMLRV